MYRRIAASLKQYVRIFRCSNRRRKISFPIVASGSIWRIQHSLLLKNMPLNLEIVLTEDGVSFRRFRVEVIQNIAESSEHLSSYPGIPDPPVAPGLYKRS